MKGAFYRIFGELDLPARYRYTTQGKANQWIHVLLPALLAALRALGDAPARSLAALAQHLGVSEADAATVVVPLEEEHAPVAPIPAAAATSPLYH
jgi:hypothetical protein